MGHKLPRDLQVKLDRKVDRTAVPEFTDLSAYAQKSQTPNFMPFSNLPQPRPAYAGPVVMVVPESSLTLITWDGTTEGGGGLVPELDYVLAQPADTGGGSPPPGVAITLTPNSVLSAALLGKPTLNASSNRIIFGTNAGNVAGGSETVTDRLAWFGRVPMQRWYYGLNELPATFNPAKAGGAPEKRTQVSFKFNPAEVLAGTWDQRFDSYCSSAPADWQLDMTFWHEPNKELNTGQFTAAQWRNCQIRFSNRLKALGLTNRIRIAPNVTAPRPGAGVAWSDSWMMTPDQLHAGAKWTWDTYGNPTGGFADPLDSPYPDMTFNADQIFSRLTTYGWWSSWGITEFNTPRRNHDPSESARVTCLDTFVQYVLNDSVTPPKSILLWEGNGVQFDQNFYTNATKNWWKGYCTTSA